MRKFCYITITFKSIISVLSTIVLLLCAVIGYDVINNYKTASISMNNDVTIIIDAGHGGEDGGAVSVTGVPEKDINLKISQKLNQLFINSNYNTVMIRDTDRLIYDENCNSIREKKSSDLHNRLDVTRKTDNAVLISVHQNYFEESKYYGAQVFYSGNNTESELLAQSIQDAIVTEIQPENKRQIKKSGKEIFLLNNAEIPAVMVECGFLSNVTEANLLCSEEYQGKIAEAIFNGIILFLKQRM